MEIPTPHSPHSLVLPAVPLRTLGPQCEADGGFRGKSQEGGTTGALGGSSPRAVEPMLASISDRTLLECYLGITQIHVVVHLETAERALPRLALQREPGLDQSKAHQAWTPPAAEPPHSEDAAATRDATVPRDATVLRVVAAARDASVQGHPSVLRYGSEAGIGAPRQAADEWAGGRADRQCGGAGAPTDPGSPLIALRLSASAVVASASASASASSAASEAGAEVQAWKRLQAAAGGAVWPSSSSSSSAATRGPSYNGELRALWSSHHIASAPYRQQRLPPSDRSPQAGQGEAQAQAQAPIQAQAQALGPEHAREEARCEGALGVTSAEGQEEALGVTSAEEQEEIWEQGLERLRSLVFPEALEEAPSVPYPPARAPSGNPRSERAESVQALGPSQGLPSSPVQEMKGVASSLEAALETQHAPAVAAPEPQTMHFSQGMNQSSVLRGLPLGGHPERTGDTPVSGAPGEGAHGDGGVPRGGVFRIEGSAAREGALPVEGALGWEGAVTREGAGSREGALGREGAVTQEGAGSREGAPLTCPVPAAALMPALPKLEEELSVAEQLQRMLDAAPCLTPAGVHLAPPGALGVPSPIPLVHQTGLILLRCATRKPRGRTPPPPEPWADQGTPMTSPQGSVSPSTPPTEHEPEPEKEQKLVTAFSAPQLTIGPSPSLHSIRLSPCASALCTCGPRDGSTSCRWSSQWGDTPVLRSPKLLQLPHGLLKSAGYQLPEGQQQQQNHHQQQLPSKGRGCFDALHVRAKCSQGEPAVRLPLPRSSTMPQCLSRAPEGGDAARSLKREKLAFQRPDGGTSTSRLAAGAAPLSAGPGAILSQTLDNAQDCHRVQWHTRTPLLCVPARLAREARIGEEGGVERTREDGCTGGAAPGSRGACDVPMPAEAPGGASSHPGSLLGGGCSCESTCSPAPAALAGALELGEGPNLQNLGPVAALAVVQELGLEQGVELRTLAPTSVRKRRLWEEAVGSGSGKRALGFHRCGQGSARLGQSLSGSHSAGRGASEQGWRHRVGEALKRLGEEVHSHEDMATMLSSAVALIFDQEERLRMLEMKALQLQLLEALSK